MVEGYKPVGGGRSIRAGGSVGVFERVNCASREFGDASGVKVGDLLLVIGGLGGTGLNDWVADRVGECHTKESEEDERKAVHIECFGSED